MDLTTFVSPWKRKKLIMTAPEKPKLETLAAIVVPKKTLMDDSYKDEERRIVNDDYGTYFDSCAMDLGRMFMKVYSPTFQFERKIEKGQVQYAFDSENTKVLYVLRGADRFYSSQQPEGWSNDVHGILSIQQPILNLEKASTFLQASLEYNLLDYREDKQQKFGVFYHAMDGKVKMEGIPLLQCLGIKPAAAAEFWSIMYFGKYEHKFFTPEELATLFPESAKQ